MTYHFVKNNIWKKEDYVMFFVPTNYTIFYTTCKYTRI